MFAAFFVGGELEVVEVSSPAVAGVSVELAERAVKFAFVGAESSQWTTWADPKIERRMADHMLLDTVVLGDNVNLLGWSGKGTVSKQRLPCSTRFATQHTAHSDLNEKV